jgi:hypothetical protein
MVVGCVTTYFFVEFHNKKINEYSTSPKKISFEEINESAFNRMNSLIASQDNKNANSDFISNMKKEMLDLRITKEIHQHDTHNTMGTMSVYPLLILWGAISIVGFVLLRAKELKEKTINRSYEKLLDHLEISYSQEHQSDKNNFKENELVKDFRRTQNEEV